MEMYNPSHAGRILRLHMGPGITVSALAKHLQMTRANLSMILNGRLGVSAALAIKLGEALPKTNAQFWMDIQTQYDLAHARRRVRKKIKPFLQLVKGKTSAKTQPVSGAKPRGKIIKKISDTNFRKAA